MRRNLVAIFAVAVLALPTVALASTYTAGTAVQANLATSPLTGFLCAPVGPGTSYPNTELEPWLAVNPTDPLNVVGTWQQDRYSGGASKGSSVGVSLNGGKTFTQISVPGLTKCTGGTVFERASDPWLSFSPNGTLFAMSLVETKLATGVNNPSGMAVSRSVDKGFTWSAPTFVILDTDPTKFNDKNSLTADPTNSNFAYAIWDRLDAPIGNGSLSSGENAAGYRGPTWFARTIDGGLTWEPARQIFAPGNNDQTIGNQIVVLPNGTLLDVFTLIHNDNKMKVKGLSLAVITSTDHGATWSSRPTIISTISDVAIADPDTGAAVRSGDDLAEVAVDRASGKVYVVWQDGRFSGMGEVAFSQSADGGTSWSSPIRIAGSPGVQSFTPGVAVASNGTVGVSYFDFRNNVAGGGATTDLWLAHCHSSCTSAAAWTSSHAYGPFNLENAPVARGYFLGDYQGIAAVGQSFLLMDAVAGSSANSSDIVFVKVSP